MQGLAIARRLPTVSLQWRRGTLRLLYAAGGALMLCQLLLLWAHPLLSGGVGQDVVDLYAGALALRHGLNPYTSAVAIGRHLTGIDPRVHPFAYAYPPAFAFLTQPLTWLQPAAAYRVLCLINELSVALTALLVCLSARVRRNRVVGAIVFVALASGCGFLADWYGQFTPLLALAAATAWLLASRRQYEWAGAIAVALLFKPQLGAVALLVLFLAGGRRLRRGMVLGGLVFLVLTWLGGGLAGAVSFAQTTLHDAGGHERIHDIDTLALDGDYYRLFAAPVATAIFAATIAAALGAGVWLLRLVRRPDIPLPLRQTALAALMVLDTLLLPYSHQYDSAMLLLPYILAGISLPAGRGRRIFFMLSAAAALAPYLNLFHLSVQIRMLPLIDLAAVALLCLICALWRRQATLSTPCEGGSGHGSLQLAG